MFMEYVNNLMNRTEGIFLLIIYFDFLGWRGVIGELLKIMFSES